MMQRICVECFVDVCQREQQILCANVQGRKDIVLAEYGGWYKAAAVDRLVTKLSM